MILLKDKEDELPIAALSVAQFRGLLTEMVPVKEQVEIRFEEAEFVYGLKGIQELFGVSHSTAQKLKDGVLSPAVSQVGRKIIVNRALALKLFSDAKHK